MNAGTVVGAIVLTIVHFLVTMFSMFCLLGAAMGGPSWVGFVAIAFTVLGFPGNLVIAQLGGIVGVSNGVVAGCIAATSLLWGIAGALLFRMLYRWRMRHAPGVSANTL